MSDGNFRPLKLVLVGDGDSPHLLKWARALSSRVDLWAVSSRGFLPEFDAFLPRAQRLALQTQPRFEGGNAALLRRLPEVVRWLRPIEADWLHAHYLTSHGTLAWLSRCLGIRAQLAGSAWGSDILVTPQRGGLWRWVTQRVLAACDLTTSDSRHMAQCMRDLGAREVMVFPFGLESLPARTHPKDDHLFFANRGLEDIYNPLGVVDAFARLARDLPEAQLIVAHDGSMRMAMQSRVHELGLADRVQFVGRLDAIQQALAYARARWYMSLPRSDSVSVSVLEAMAHGCIPLLSDLPANRELVAHGDNGWILPPGAEITAQDLTALRERAEAIGEHNRAWVSMHAIFPQDVDQFVQRLKQLQEGRCAGQTPPLSL